jgi:MoaA/NifB/PqqE/SkfB family radical SAM enzyme
MSVRYTPSDYLHFGRMLWRHRARQKLWQREYETAVGGGSFQLRFPSCVTLIPTETCNLRCPMCNQWGQEGYFLRGARTPQHMESATLGRLLEPLDPARTMLFIHGGEPFAYKHIDALLDRVAERAFDVLITTNGTLMEQHLEPLARIRNLSLLYSIDGDEETHDRVRGKGNFRRSASGLAALFERRRRIGLPLPMVVMGFVVCEWTTGKIETAYRVARALGVFGLNYTMRYFLPVEAGVDYEGQLRDLFDLRSSGAWRGWVSPSHARHDYTAAAASLARVLRRQRLRLSPPFVFVLPRRLKGRRLLQYFEDYYEVFGNESCFMPFYWARVHSNGDMIFCPGHPDIIVGNVFRDGFMNAFNSERSIALRRHILNNRFPICNRCCGLYITYAGRPYEQRARRNLGLGRSIAGWSAPAAAPGERP